VESFFDAQGGGRWTAGDSTANLYNEDGSGGHNVTYELCPTSMNGPKGTSEVSLITVTCVLGGPPTSTTPQALSLLVATADMFVPAAAPWVQTTLTAGAPVDYTKTFGNTVVYLGIGNGSKGSGPIWNLAVQARGYKAPAL
jgi:hypothetical protein